ncbi:MAG: hypothetical protein MJ246_06465 [Clostridia bacterium]|nr:hypothetical protein [Clostridia bacterium]
MKRGLSVMTLMGLSIALAAIGGSPLFSLPIVLFACWSFFDTWNLRNMSDEKRKEFKDELVWNTEEWKSFVPKTDDKKKKSIFGISLIFIGVYMILVMIFGELREYFEVLSSVYYFLRDDFLAMAIAAVVVYIGIKLVKD